MFMMFCNVHVFVLSVFHLSMLDGFLFIFSLSLFYSGEGTDMDEVDDDPVSLQDVAEPPQKRRLRSGVRGEQREWSSQFLFLYQFMQLVNVTIYI